jgi:hypothetical protein
MVHLKHWCHFNEEGWDVLVETDTYQFSQFFAAQNLILKKLTLTDTNTETELGTGATAKSAIKKELKENMTNEWNHTWQSTIDYRQTKVWFPDIDIPKSEKLMKHTRPTVGGTARNISGFAFYRRQSAIRLLIVGEVKKVLLR